jgi:hypothetical protein
MSNPINQYNVPLSLVTGSQPQILQNVSDIYKFINFINNTSCNITVTGNGLPVFVCPAGVCISVPIPINVLASVKINYIMSYTGLTGTVQNATVILTDESLNLNVVFSTATGSSVNIVANSIGLATTADIQAQSAALEGSGSKTITDLDTDTKAITTELTTLAASTTLAQLLTALGSGGAITTELTTLAASTTLAQLLTALGSGGAITTELTTLAASTTLAQLLTALGSGGAITTELTTLAASTTLAQLLTALGSGGAITTELSTLAASKTLATLDTDLLALIAQNNSAYPTGKTPFFYQAVALAGIVTITIPAVAAKLINITNMSIMVSTAAILSPTVNIIQDIAGTPVQMWEGAVAVSAVNEVIHENFNPPLQSNIANKTVTFNMNSLGAAVYGFININGYYSAS